MSQVPACTSYDDLPYISRAFGESFPDRLAAVAELFGMEPRPEPVTRCRVLELGCAQGNNIIPMAVALPDAEFHAVDASGRQIEEGRRQVAKLGLRNLRLEQLDFAAFPEDAGRYHYIVAHGVYSWVSPAHRDALLEVCRRHLAANGIAYVSYNVRPPDLWEKAMIPDSGLERLRRGRRSA